MDNSIKSLKIRFIIAIGIVTIILTSIYILIEISNFIHKDKWQSLIINIEGFALAILLGFYTVIRMDRTERWRKEDKLTELYAEALRNLYTTEKEELQLLGIRELYNTYQEFNQKVSPKFEGQLQRKILDSIFEYLHEIGVREVDDDKQSKDKAANKIFDLFLRGDLSFPKGYLIHLEDADLQNADLQGANLQRANLQRANLKHAYLQNADLRVADLQGAGLGFAKLQGADLEDAKLQKANLLIADLQGANLLRANLQGANLHSANLQNADLQGASLGFAKLQGAKLQGANLQSADLQGADLGYYLYLQGANLQGAVIYEDNSSIDIDLLIDKKNKRVFKEYGWKVEMQVKKEIVGDKLVEVKQYVLTVMDF